MTNAEPPLRVVVADDQSAVREGLALLLETLPGISVVAQAADGDAAVEAVARTRPQIALLDLHMPRCDGIQATRRIRLDHADTQVVVLTTYADESTVVRVLQAGAIGYLTKDADREQIRRALYAAAAGQAVLDAAAHQRLITAAARSPRPADPSEAGDLTSREIEVLRLLAAGSPNRAIARALFVSEATVKTHVNHIFAKTGARDRSAATRYAYDHGYAVPPGATDSR